MRYNEETGSSETPYSRVGSEMKQRDMRDIGETRDIVVTERQVIPNKLPAAGLKRT